MSRARIVRVVLMNWRGVFYQPLELSEGLTGLEGPNGSGKTSVMVATFCALLPDQRLLSFKTTQGDTGGDNERGVYGRLGHPGPAYSIIEYRAPDETVFWAGVLLERHTEPRMSFTLFHIDNLPADRPLENILLLNEGNDEHIPTLPELREQIGIAGGTLHIHESLPAYSGLLYERGVLPLPLSTYEERERFHKVLATSMMGGLSSFIQKGLREYLLAEDTQLRSHVGRMRENLEACRV
jgi:chromosome partition protein MukB